MASRCSQLLLLVSLALPHGLVLLAAVRCSPRLGRRAAAAGCAGSPPFRGSCSVAESPRKRVVSSSKLKRRRLERFPVRVLERCHGGES
eukprot:14728271-Alexandrium_andersonii.AAC.1